MTSRDFCYWLQGYFEVAADAGRDGFEVLTIGQIECIKKHLALVFKHEIDPSFGPAEKQVLLNKIHGPSKDPLIRC